MREYIQNLLSALSPEVLLIATACLLLLIGCSSKELVRRIAPVIALIALGIAIFIQWPRTMAGNTFFDDAWKQVLITPMGHYFRLVTLLVAVPLVLLTWPVNRDATAGRAIDFGKDTADFFALMLLSLSGVLLVAAANDLILLFLAFELASIPTYIMVSISRPTPVAQEAGVKYFFLGAMAAAVLLFGMSYLYGTTGLIHLNEIAAKFQNQNTGMLPWQMLAIVMMLAGFGFKMAAVPLHAYAADVYQGAATPVTAFLSFVPKATGLIAIIKILWVAGGGSWAVPAQIVTLVAVLAVLTMTVGNVLGLLQNNIKRVFAYSSISHSGYMLVGLAALLATTDAAVQRSALGGVLFYLAAYGVMNAGAFGVLMLLPSRNPQPATTAETFDDLAGTGRKNVALGLAMAVCCFSLTGMPLTVGFLGKAYLIKPTFDAGLNWLVIALVINAAISAAYYLRIVGTMFLRSDAPASDEPARPSIPAPIGVAIALSVVGTLLLGVSFRAITLVTDVGTSAVETVTAPR